MDSSRFDNWTRNRALRLSRRDALRLAGVGGATVAFAVTHADSLAQSTCTLTLHGETAGEPPATTAIDGTLTFSIDANGALNKASFAPASGTPQSVTGSIEGRAIDLLIDSGAGKLLMLSGATDSKAPNCPGVAAGILTGPGGGVIGAWQASSTAVPGATSAQSGTGSTGCTAPSITCGPNCCPGGAICTDANQGICTCPPGTAQCGLKCVTNCPNGQALDLDTCSCTSNCVADQSACNSNLECCSGFCDTNAGTCQSCQFLACDGVGCVDPSIDANHCGGCGIVCAAPKGSCTEGVCACQPDGLPCVKHYDCCSDSCANGICGCVTVGGDCSNFDSTCCDNGVTLICTSGTCRYLDSRHACFADNECLTGICSNGACMSCVDPGGACTRSAECCNYNGLGCVNGICPQ
jgi:hypothetical protein